MLAIALVQEAPDQGRQILGKLLGHAECAMIQYVALDAGKFTNSSISARDFGGVSAP